MKRGAGLRLLPTREGVTTENYPAQGQTVPRQRDRDTSVNLTENAVP